MPVYAGRVRRITPTLGLQNALDSARPGDVITLAPGVYYESIKVSKSGEPGAPIVICAEEGGTATISGGTPPDFKLEFGQVEGDVFTATVPWPVRWVMVDGRNLNAYGSLDNLKSFSMQGHDSRRIEDGPPEGFAWEDGSLYVRLLGGMDPGKAEVEIHRMDSGAKAPPLRTSARAWSPGGGTNVTINASHVVLSGLRLHLAPDVAVRVNGANVTIRDCYIDGAHRGIEAGRSPNLTVEYCEFTGYPTYQWVRWGHWGGVKNRGSLWNVIYNSNLCITFMHHDGPSVKVRHNLIYECFDGMWPRNMGTLDPAMTSEYAYNALMSCGDDSIEFDTRRPINLRVHHNFIMDALVLLAISPVQGGGLTIDHNIVYVSPERGLRNCTLFKFDCPWRRRYGAPTTGLRIVHNTLINTRNTLYWTTHKFEDSVLENNILYAYRSNAWRLPGFVPSKHNMYAGPSINPDHLSHLIHAKEPGFRVAPSLDAEPLPVLPLQEAGVAERSPEAGEFVDFRLRPDSPGVDAGAPGMDEAYHHSSRGRAPDLGAIELGETWQFPRPGPRWATGEKTPWRPSLPPSLDPQWVGLD